MRRLLIVAAALALCGNAQAGGNAANGRTLSEKGVTGGVPCASCHGIDGAKPVAPDQPILAGQYPDYLYKALQDYKSGKRANPIMKSMAGPLKRQDMEDLAAWFSSQKSNLHFQR